MSKNKEDSQELSQVTKLDLKEHAGLLVPEAVPALMPFRDLKADSVPINLRTYVFLI